MISIKMTEASLCSFFKIKRFLVKLVMIPVPPSPLFHSIAFYLNIIHSLWQTASLRNLKQNHCGAYEKRSDDDKSYRYIKGASWHLQFVCCHLTSNKTVTILLYPHRLSGDLTYATLKATRDVCFGDKRHTTTTSVTTTLKKQKESFRY